MQVEIEKSALIMMVSLAQTVAEKRANMPHLINLFLEAENDELKIFATDLEISVASKTKAKVIQSGKVTIHAKHFFEVVKELNDLPIQLTAQDNFWLKIQQKRYNSKLLGSDPNQYPVFPVIGSCEFIKVEAALLKEMIAKVIFCVSNDDTRYHLNAVYLERYFENNKFYLRMAATDSHKLSVVNKCVDSVTLKEGDFQPSGVIVPRKGIQELNKILESVDKSVELAIEGAQLIVKHGDTVLLIRLIEGKYPSYQKLIPQKINHKILLPREALYSVAKRVSFHSHQKSKCVVMELSTSKLKLSASNAEIGEASDEIEVSYEGPNLKVNLNARYLMEILSASQSELVDIEIRDISSPIVIRPHGDLDYTSVIMPMRF